MRGADEAGTKNGDSGRPVGPAEQGQLVILASGPRQAADVLGPVFGAIGRQSAGAVGYGRADISAARLALGGARPAAGTGEPPGDGGRAQSGARARA